MICCAALVCVDASCVGESTTCEVPDQLLCRTVGGQLGYYECVFADGGTLGVWNALVQCGPVAQSLCVNGTPKDGSPCLTPTATEANCADNVDNDKDGDTDCDDADCANDPACVCT